MWHVQELGGGLYSSVQRSDACIDAYSAMIEALDVDVCILLGVRKGLKKKIVQGKMADGAFCLQQEEGDKDTGFKEVARILKSLQKSDSNSEWKLFVPKDSEGEITYRVGCTAAFLYRSGKGLKLIEEQVVPGHTMDVACATFQIFRDIDEKPWNLPLAAPLSVEANSGETPQKIALPSPCLVAFSTSSDLRSSGAQQDLCRTLNTVPRFTSNGTVLNRPFWESKVEECGGLLGNPLILNAGDVRTHDKYMHWQAMNLPSHPDELNEVVGRLSDGFMICQSVNTGLFHICENRVIDLLSATLDSDSPLRSPSGENNTDESGNEEASASSNSNGNRQSGKTNGQGRGKVKESGDQAEQPSEEGVLKDAFKKHRASEKNIVNPEDDADRAATLGACIDFVRRLSDHWPVLTRLGPDS